MSVADILQKLPTQTEDTDLSSYLNDYSTEIESLINESISLIQTQKEKGFEEVTDLFSKAHHLSLEIRGDIFGSIIDNSPLPFSYSFVFTRFLELKSAFRACYRECDYSFDDSY